MFSTYIIKSLIYIFPSVSFGSRTFCVWKRWQEICEKYGKGALFVAQNFPSRTFCPPGKECKEFLVACQLQSKRLYFVVVALRLFDGGLRARCAYCAD
jgi:hypothetical protein